MNTPARIHSLLIEFHRFGASEGLIRKGERYIRAAGWDEPLHEVTIELSTEEFLQRLGALRYVPGTAPEEAKAALDALAKETHKMLNGLREVPSDTLVHIDLVTSAAELWAFPFESWMDSTPVFASRERRMVPTRRIRSELGERDFVWPAKPRILFAHAPVASDLSEELVAEQAAALANALEPWRKGRDPMETQLLTVREVRGPWALHEERGKAPYTHIHILAHGAPLFDRRLPGQTRWGLRFGEENSKPTGPTDVAEALQPRDGLPVVVSLAACDSANEANPLAGASLAQELHRRGVPVVLASQLPLTEQGATLMTEGFYSRVLVGEDVRSALHEVRVTLYEALPKAHDWLSVVAYVRLPRHYANHLEEVALRANLAMLEASYHKVNSLSVSQGTRNEFADVERRIRARICDLEERFAQLDPDKRSLYEECAGLLASAHKRLAELLFKRTAVLTDGEAARQREASREALIAAWSYYRRAFYTNIHSHWTGAQQLSLEAALTGRFSHPTEWHAALRAAELDCEKGPQEYWAFVSIAELNLLAPFTKGNESLTENRRALEIQEGCRALATFKAHVPASNGDAIPLTRRQFNRYVEWWTCANGFFPNGADLANDAKALVAALD